MTIGFLAMALTSMIWGTLSDRFGPLPVVLTGSIVLAASLALASRAPSLLSFQIMFGLMVGGSIAAIFAPMMACVTGWFDTHRSLAVSLVSAGMGMAPMIMSPLAAWLVSNHDWRTSMQVMAVVVAAIMIPVSLLVRRPPALESGNVAAAGDDAPSPEMSRAQALRSPQFIILLATNFLCCATHSGPIIHTVSYAVTCGIPMMAAVTIYSVEGLAGMGGRIAFGLLGDRFGAKRVLVAGFSRRRSARSLTSSCGSLPRSTRWRRCSASSMPAPCRSIRCWCARIFRCGCMGTVIGGTAMAGSLGMATGPLAGGLIYDTFASYAWLYIGSWAVGLGAFLIAMTFRPFPKGASAARSRWRREAEILTEHLRHGRARPGHLRPSCCRCPKTWMPGT